MPARVHPSSDQRGAAVARFYAEHCDRLHTTSTHLGADGRSLTLSTSSRSAASGPEFETDSSGRVAVIVEGGAATLAQLHDVLLAILPGAKIDRGRLHRRVAEKDAHVGDVRAGAQQLRRARPLPSPRRRHRGAEDVGNDLPRPRRAGIARRGS